MVYIYASIALSTAKSDQNLAFLAKFSLTGPGSYNKNKYSQHMAAVGENWQ